MRYVFGECELDTERYELRRRDQVVALEPLALRVLAYFVQHPGQAVAKGDLFQAFWPGAAEESYKEYSLRNCLTKIRQTVGDAGTPRAVLDTVRRYGYRFTTEVTVLPSAPSPTGAGTQGATDATVSPGAGPDALLAALPDAVVRCPQCQTPTPATHLFCTACGQALACACPQCGARNDPTARFCGGCGHAATVPAAPDPAPELAVPPLPTASAPSLAEAERRQLTVLFCDLVDSTRLARQLDPEDWRDVVQAYQQTCAAVIQRFDGYIAQYLGDGLLVYFGYPQAHEDDAQRAVRTGLDMVEAMSPLNTTLARDHRVRLAVRVGIHTGLVVVGAMGSGDRQEHLALGATPNLAARLQGQAAPDTVVISAATHQLVQGLFTCQTLETPTLKGLDEPLTLYQVLALSPAPSPFAAASFTRLTPLVGREEELGLLRRRWAQVQEGNGQVVLLGGEAGIGKSRLVRELYEAVEPDQATRLVFRCAPSYQQSALYPVIEHLQRLVRESGKETPEAQCARLEKALRRAGMPVPEVLPLLAALRMLPHPADYPPLQLTAERQKQKTQEALIAWLVAEAAQQPVLMVWEDLHWADPSTLELFGLLLEQAPMVRLLTVLTCRPTFVPPWASRATLTQLTLTRLTHPQVEAMVQRVAGGKALPVAVLRQLVARTDGVPLFVEELTKTVLEVGGLQEAAEHDDLTGPLPALAMPATLQDALRARLDRLSEGKAVAQLGAVLGRTFSYEVLQAVTPLDELALWRGLRQLVQTEVLYQRGALPQATYLFKHALIQEAAYQSLLKSTRQQFHQCIAQVLETRFPATVETQPELVAQHYTAAGCHDQAIPYWQQAGQHASDRSAYREAIAALEQALEALQHLPDTRETREQAIDLRLALRVVLRPLGDQVGRMLAYLREAEALAVTLDDPQRLGRVSGALSLHFYLRGAYDQAIANSQRALALATANGDEVQQAQANQFLGECYLAHGDYHRAIACFRQAMAVFEGARRHEHLGVGHLRAVGYRAWLASCQAELGTFAEGGVLGDEGLRIAEAVAHPGSLMWASYGIGLLALRHGDLSRALPLLERAVGICQNADLLAWFPRMAAPLGAAYTLGGRVADAVALLTQALAPSPEGHEWHETPPSIQLCSLSLAEAQVRAGRLAEAHAVAERTLALACERKERGHEAYALCLLGEIAARREPPEVEQAESLYQQAITLADELGMRPLQAHCHRGLGTLYAATGQGEQAQAELCAAMHLYRSMEMTFWLPQVEAALAQVDGR